MSTLVFNAGRPGAFMFGNPEDVNHVVARAGKLRLREQRQQVIVPAVAVHNENLLAAVARHLLHRFLEQRELCLQAVGHRSGLLLSLKDLAEIILGKHDCILLPHRVENRESNIEQVGSQRQVRSVLLEDPEGQHTNPLRLMNRLDKVGPGKLLPFAERFAWE